jgi:hypothetical protein
VSLGPPVEMVVGCAVGDDASRRTRPTLAIDQADSSSDPSVGDFPLTINNRLRTGADKGNPTV